MIPSPQSHIVPGTPSQPERLTAMFALLLSYGTFGIVPLIIFLVKKDESKFVGYHGMLGFLSVVTVALVSAAAWVLSLMTLFLSFLSFLGCLFIGLPLILAFALLAFMVMGAISAYNGDYAKVPVVSDWAKKIVGVGP